MKKDITTQVSYSLSWIFSVLENFRNLLGSEKIEEDTFNCTMCFTGDTAYFDDEGYLFVIDRIKDVMFYNGSNVSESSFDLSRLLSPLSNPIKLLIQSKIHAVDP